RTVRSILPHPGARSPEIRLLGRPVPVARVWPPCAGGRPMSDAPNPVIRPLGRAGLSIQSILLIMLLLVSITSNVVVGILGYLNGNDALRSAAIDRVVEVRDSRAREIERLFETIEDSMLVHSRGQSVIQASADCNAAFAALADVELGEEEVAAVDAYFADGFGPALSEALGEQVDVAPFLPTTPAQRYLT